MATADDYTWINDDAISEAGCVTVVPAADRSSVLAAFGVDATLPPPSADAVMDGGAVFVAQVGDALVLLEDNGFEGTRPEVLGPLSSASRQQLAASFFWNVNAVTSFSAARDGTVEFAVEILGAEDEDLDDVPSALHPLVLEGGADDGDLLGAGLALVAGHTGVTFTAEVWDTGRWYVVVHVAGTPGAAHEEAEIHDLPGAAARVAALPAPTQRRLATWAVRAAVVESGIGDEPAVRRALEELADPTATLSPSDELDALARRATKAFADFDRLEEDLRVGGINMPRHPYFMATVAHDGPFGESTAISHLEGAYLNQRRWAVDAVRHLTIPDAYGAAATCLQHASTVFALGRTTRGWTFTETEDERYLDGHVPAPRHQQFVRVVDALLADLEAAPDAGADADLWRRADAGLPDPLTPEERQRAIEADATAAAEGAFDEYQMVDVEDDEYPPWAGAHEPVHLSPHGGVSAVADLDHPDDIDELPEEVVRAMLKGMLRAPSGPVSIIAVDESEPSRAAQPGGPARSLERELALVDASIEALERPHDVLAAITEPPSGDVVGRLGAAFGWDAEQTEAVLDLPFRRLQEIDLLRRFRADVMEEIRRRDDD